MGQRICSARIEYDLAELKKDFMGDKVNYFD